MLEIIRHNLGIIALVTLFVFHQVCKFYMKKLQQKLYNPFLRFGSLVNSYPALEKCDYKEQSVDDAHYYKKKHIGVEFFVIHSAELANKISSQYEYFEDSTFITRTIAFSRMLFGISDANEESLQSNDSFIALNRKYKNVTSETENSSSIDQHQKSSSREDDNVKTNEENVTMKETSKGSTQKQRSKEQTVKSIEAGNSKTNPIQENSENMKMRESNPIKILKSYDSVLAESFPLIKHCIKELIILLEAKSNRKDLVDIKSYCYKHAVNVLGVCVFGKRINELTNSRCRFYDHCQELHEFWVHSEKHRLRKYVDSVLVNMGILEIEKPVAAIEYIKTLVRNCFQGQHDGYENCLVKVLADTMDNSDNSIELTASFLIVFTVNMVEVMGGVMSLMLHKLSMDIEVQEKIRNNDKIEFNLEGVPHLSLENINRLTFTDTLIEKTFRTHPIDPVIQLTCKQSYSIPESNILINPKCVILIPTHVLSVDNYLHNRISSLDPDSRQRMAEHIFITSQQTQFVSTFVRRFADVWLKTSLTSLIQEYEFTTDIKVDYKEITSCRFSTLPSTLPLRAARVEKRGKVVIFEESLKAFYDSKDVSFLSKIGL